jgi:hypothetical protein
VPQARVFRQAGREIAAVRRGKPGIHGDLRNRLVLIVAATIVVDLLGTLIIFMFERHAHGTQIETLGDSIFWTTTQLLTVSSQLPNPISTGGRITDVFLQAYAISVVATLAGSFSAFFHHRSLERHGLREHPTPPAKP